MIEIDVTRRIAASPQAVWDVYTDQEGWTQWAGVGTITLQKAGDTEKNGVGAVRAIKAIGPAIVERVTRADAPERFDYTLIAGAPVKNHAGSVTFTPDGDGTLVHWSIRFDAAVFGIGWILKLVLNAALKRILSRLDAKVAG
ncbi:MAG: hypothetical protein ACI9WU_005031 [Myxococcota bacterium]|jgi:uncharacterized protein YndB with AHSA1/START domain